MKQNKKRALFYVLLFVLGVVFGLTKINGQAEDGYLLKADEKGNDDLIYNYPLEKDQGYPKNTWSEGVRLRDSGFLWDGTRRISALMSKSRKRAAG